MPVTAGCTEHAARTRHRFKHVSYIVSGTGRPQEAVLLLTGDEPEAQRGLVTCPGFQKCRGYNAGVSDPGTADDGMGEKQWH